MSNLQRHTFATRPNGKDEPMSKHQPPPKARGAAAREPLPSRNAAAPLTRRQFLKGAAAAGAVIAAPTFVPASALGRGGAVAPSERIVLGGIGIGNRGSYDLNWMMAEPDVQFVA